MAETNHCIDQHKLGYTAVTKKPQTSSNLMQCWFIFHSQRSYGDSTALQDSCPPCRDDLSNFHLVVLLSLHVVFQPPLFIASKQKWHISAHSLLVRRNHMTSPQLQGSLGNAEDHMEYLMGSIISSRYTDGRKTSWQLKLWRWDMNLAGSSTENPLSEGCDLKPGDSWFSILDMPEPYHHHCNLLSGWN